MIGSGGKTTFLRTLGEELAAAGKRVILTTTTKIYPFSGMPLVVGGQEEELESAFAKSRILCCGTPLTGTEKLCRCAIAMERLALWADYVLVEGDGSAGLPLKAHGPQEPVIPPESDQVIQVVGWSGIGQPIWKCVHRPERFARIAGVDQECDVTPSLAAAVLNEEHLGTRYFINQADSPVEVERAKELGGLLPQPCHIGSLKERESICL